MKNPSRRARRAGTVIATPVAVVAAAALVWQSSHAAFSGSTRNSGNNWSTGSVAITDDDAGSAAFQVSTMLPGATGERCITVTVNTDVAGTVKGYLVNPVLSPAGLENHVMLSSTLGAANSGGGFGSCDGFIPAGEYTAPVSLGTAAAQSYSYETGGGAYDVQPGTTTRIFKITWEFDTAGLTQTQINALQGAATGMDFQWELRSAEPAA